MNRLATETSPYLRQHKDNPVHWWPWGPEALAEAKATGKPILLSIGYAACHWCHVMAHESFEDEPTADLMNALFVNVKVDREERPDIDKIYMTALQLMTRQGGWPMTMFLNADGVPFYGGTYFPKIPRDGMPSFASELERVAAAYTDQADAVASNVGQVLQTLNKIASFDARGAISEDDLTNAATRITSQFDPVKGGLLGAPKFPQTQLIDFLIRRTLRDGDPQRQKAITAALDAMCRGGIYDHLGGGFARYTVDDQWLIPHFEKMLYDNAQLLELLIMALQQDKSPLYETAIVETANWVLREMTAPGGGFTSSYDADSEGVEGKFYVWSAAEIEGALGDAADVFKAAYDVSAAGNWEGSNILNRLGSQPALTQTEAVSIIASKAKLLERRSKRVAPGWDDKVLADWNGLMIAALAQASATFKEPRWLNAAEAAYRFIIETMSVKADQKTDRLFHASHEGTAAHMGNADDYANMIHAALSLFEVTGNAGYLAKAEAWVAVLQTHFWDKDQGGYFFTADDGESLIIRMRSVADEATPNANGTMVSHLTRLWHLTGKDDYRAQAQSLIEAFAGGAANQPLGVGSFLAGVDFYLNATQIVVLGRRGDDDTQSLLDQIHQIAVPNRVLSVIEPGKSLPDTHPAFGKTAVDGKACAYICRGTMCSLPVVNADDLRHALSSKNQ